MVERTADGKIRTTEWEDIQYKHGNKVGQYVDREVEIIAQRLAAQQQNVFLKVYNAEEEKLADKIERKGIAESKLTEENLGAEVSDELDDEDLAMLRRKRLDALKKEANESTNGSLRHVSGKDYVTEITEASRGKHWVIALMIKQGQADSDKLVRIMAQAALRNRTAKFVSVFSNEAVANFPEKHLPCTLLYFDGSLVEQLTSIDAWKRDDEVSLESVEKNLHVRGVISRDEYDEEESVEVSHKTVLRDTLLL